MADKIRIRARLVDGQVVVKALIPHPMETGRRTDEATGKTAPAHFIQTVVAKHNGEIVFEADWGTGVSRNPFVAFMFEGGKAGDKVELTWRDNTGATGTVETEIK